jgi:hypothetical protein
MENWLFMQHDNPQGRFFISSSSRVAQERKKKKVTMIVTIKERR